MNANVFAQLTKVDEEKRLIFGRAAQEQLDRSGEVFDYETSKPFFQSWSSEMHKASGGKSLGNVRAMHGAVAAGKLEEMHFFDAGKAIDVVAKVVDDTEWKKVLEGVYTGFSIGGSYVRKWNDEVDGKTVRRYTAAPNEISLVDRPCMPGAEFFDIAKADGTTEKHAFQKGTTDGDGDKGGSGTSDGDGDGDETETENKKKALPEGEGEEMDKGSGENCDDATKKMEVKGSADDLMLLADVMQKNDFDVKAVIASVESAVKAKADAERMAKGLFSLDEINALFSSFGNAAELIVDEEATPVQKAVGQLISSLGDVVKASVDDLTAIAEEGLVKTDVFSQTMRKRFVVEDLAPLTEVIQSYIELTSPKKDEPVKKAVEAEQLQKLEMANEELIRITAEMAHRLQKLEAQPLQTTVALFAVEKGAAAPEDKDPDPILKQDGSVDEAATSIKKLHLGGGKLILQRPQSGGVQ